MGQGNGEWSSSSDGGSSHEGGAGGSSPGEGGTEVTPEEQQLGEEAYAQLDPQELALASSLAGNMTCALAGAVESAQLDPAAIDDETLRTLLEQYGPGAMEQARAWLSGADPSTLAYSMIPKTECIEQFGCEFSPRCKQNYIPTMDHLCFIDDCGKAKCRTCPDLVNQILENVVIRSWCSYVCVQTATSPPKVIAVGAGAISALRNRFFGPICVPYP